MRWIFLAARRALRLLKPLAARWTRTSVAVEAWWRRRRSALRARKLRSGVERAVAARGQRSAGRAGADPPRAETGRIVPRGAVRRRDAERIAPVLCGGEERSHGRRQLRASRRSPMCAIWAGCCSAPVSRCRSPMSSARRCAIANSIRWSRDLRAMGETNALAERSREPLSRATCWRQRWRTTPRTCRPDGQLRATFDIVYLTGWAPHESQQKPLKPGSAKARLADALGTKEIAAGEARRRSGQT